MAAGGFNIWHVLTNRSFRQAWYNLSNIEQTTTECIQAICVLMYMVQQTPFGKREPKAAELLMLFETEGNISFDAGVNHLLNRKQLLSKSVVKNSHIRLSFGLLCPMDNRQHCVPMLEISL